MRIQSFGRQSGPLYFGGVDLRRPEITINPFNSRCTNIMLEVAIDGADLKPDRYGSLLVNNNPSSLMEPCILQVHVDPDTQNFSLVQKSPIRGRFRWQNPNTSDETLRLLEVLQANLTRYKFQTVHCEPNRIKPVLIKMLEELQGNLKQYQSQNLQKLHKQPAFLTQSLREGIMMVDQTLKLLTHPSSNQEGAEHKRA